MFSQPASHRIGEPTRPCDGRWRLALFGAILAYYFGLVLWPGMFRVLGLSHEFGWFWDSYAILASNDASAAGLDPYATNPLDRLGRPHVYSHWWLGLSSWGWTRQDNFLLGGICVAAFFGAVFAWLRPRSPKEAGIYMLMLASPAVVLGVERANNDVLIFAVVAAMIPLLANRREWVRWLALAPWVVATLLKFYPAAAVVALVMGRCRREVVARGLAATGLLGLMWLDLTGDFAVLGRIIPRPEGLLTLGAPQVFAEAGMPWSTATVTGLVLGGAALAVCWWSSASESWAENRNPQADEVAFVIGAALLVGCFFTGASYAYRYVHALLLAPWLWRRAHEEGAPSRVRRMSTWALALLVAALWFDGLVLSILACFAHAYPVDSLLALADRIAFWRHPAVWALMLCLLWLLAREARKVWSGVLVGDEQAADATVK